MPTLIYADERDDTSSIRVKLERASSTIVGIVVPGRNPQLESQIAMRVIARQAESLGLEVAILSRSGRLRQLAAEEGLPTFQSADQFARAVAERARQNEADEQANQESRRRSIPSMLRVFGLLALLGLGLGSAYVLIPSSTVTVTPKTETISGSVDVIADPDARAVDAKNRRAPARVIYLLVETTDLSPTGEGRPSGGNRAVGMVTFTNRNTSQIEIPAGTIVSTTNRVRFRTESQVTLKGGVGTTGQTQVTAVAAGSEGNVDRLAIKEIDGQAQQYALVQNEEPTAGGGEVLVVTSLDRDHLQQKATDRARQEALAKLATLVQSGEMLVQDSFDFVPLDVSFDRAIGQEALILNVQMKARVAATVINLADTREVTMANWKPSPRPGFEVATNGVRVLPPEIRKLEGRLIYLTSKAEAVTFAQVNVAGVQQYARWRSKADLERDLPRMLDLAKPPTVRVEPSWADRAFRVGVQVYVGGGQ